MRLAARFGGDPHLVVRVSIGNDTGSNLQSLYPPELHTLRFDPQTYQGIIGPTFVGTATGIVRRYTIWVEIMVLKDGVTPLTDWIMEEGVVTPEQVGMGNQRLSGAYVRRHLYFATAPGNYQLFVAQKKNGLVSQLPVV